MPPLWGLGFLGFTPATQMPSLRDSREILEYARFVKRTRRGCKPRLPDLGPSLSFFLKLTPMGSSSCQPINPVPFFSESGSMRTSFCFCSMSKTGFDGVHSHSLMGSVIVNLHLFHFLSLALAGNGIILFLIVNPS